LAYLTRTRVPYPREAIALHQQGTVILRVLVGTDGIAQTIEIEKSSGSRALDNAARDAVRRWTFQAGTRNGIRAALWARVPIRFDLQTL
jgi:protein TonB